MKKLLSILTAVIFSLAANAAGEKVSAEFDRKSGIYQCGEKAEFTITVTGKDGKKLEKGDLLVTFSNGYGTKRQINHVFDLAKGNPVKVSGTMDTPDILRANFNYRVPGGKYGYLGVKNVVFSPEKILPGAACPADFNAFWQQAVAGYAKVPADVKVHRTFVHRSTGCNVTEFSVAAPKGRVYGFVSIPADKSKKYPVLVNIAAAGPGFNSAHIFEKDFIMLSLNVHDSLPAEVGNHYNKMCSEAFARTGYKGWGAYLYEGLEDRRTAYFFSPVIGLDRAIDYVCQLPQADPERVGYFGISQGGGLGLIMAGLNPRRFKAVVVTVPALCDHHGFAEKRACGWPGFAKYLQQKYPAKVDECLYFDAVNFARNINTSSVRLIVGLEDLVCAPTSGIAAYNVIPSADKELFIMPGYGHVGTPKYGELRQWLKAKISE